MARLHGRGGSITFASGYVARIKGWTMQRTLLTEDAAELGFEEQNADEGGLKNTTGTYQCWVDSAASLVDVGISATAVFTLGGTKTITVKCVTTDFNIDLVVDKLVLVTYSWKQGGSAATGQGPAGDFTIA